MRPKQFYFLMMTLSLSAYGEGRAEEPLLEPVPEVREESEAVFASSEEESSSARPLVTTVSKKEASDQTPSPKKLKPHFAGAKRPLEVKKTSHPQKPKRVKNPWFSSKTQPKKVEKKMVRDEEVSHLPEDHPYFVRTDGLLAQAGSIPRGQAANTSSAERSIYPKTGFQAPRGHVFLTGDWLYWRIREEGMEFVTNTSLCFDYTSGFRVGLGVHLPYTDGWDILAEYTYFAPDASRSVTGSFYPLFLFQGSGASGPAVTAAQGHWSVNFQTMDLKFGRAFYLSRSLNVHPFMGMKGAWMDQQAHFDYEGGYIPDGLTFTTRLKNDFKGAGPLLGSDLNWIWGAGFSLRSAISTSLVMGHFDNHQHQDQLISDVVDYKRAFNLVSPMVQMAIALAWDRNFNQERSHVGIYVGFETQYWWSQNQTELFTGADVPSYQRQKGDLSLYGLTLQARLDF